MTPAMDKLLDYYTVTVDRETGSWTGLPVATGKAVARDEWLSLMKDDADHFQLVTLTSEDLTGYSMAADEVIERAVFVTWSDEMLQ